MIQPLIILLFFILMTLSSLAQEIELEDINDLSILDEFEQDELNLTKKNEAPESKAVKDFSTEEQEIEENLNFLAEDLPPEDQESETSDLKNLGLVQTDLDDLESIKAVDLNDEALKANQEGDEDIDFKLIEEFSKYTESNHNEIIEKLKQDKKMPYSNFEIEALKVQLEDIVKSNLRLYYIPKGTQLTRMSDTKKVHVTHPVVVRAYTQLDFNKDRYIINKRGHLVYKTHYKKISDIKKIADLYRRPHRMIKYPPKKLKQNLTDQNFPYSFFANAHLGINIPSYTNELILGKSTTAPLFRADFIFISQKSIGFNTGLALNYETTTGALENGGTYQHAALAIGPHFRRDNLWGNMALTFRPSLSLFSQLTVAANDETDTLKLTETSMALGLEKESKIKKGDTLIFGISAQRKWLNVASSSTSYTVESSTRSDDSFTFYVGHKSDWSW